MGHFSKRKKRVGEGSEKRRTHTHTWKYTHTMSVLMKLQRSKMWHRDYRSDKKCNKWMIPGNNLAKRFRNGMAN